MRTRLATVILAASALGLGGCAYNGLGVGVGYGSPYGYSPYGYGGYYSPYYSPYRYSRYGYGGLGYGYPYGGLGYGLGYGMGGFPYFGWHNGWYYPGTGYYVYDRDRRPRIWTEGERNFWAERLKELEKRSGGQVTTTAVQPNWSGFSRQRTVRTNSVTVDRPRRSQRVQEVRSAREERRAERRATISTSRETRRSNRRRDD